MSLTEHLGMGVGPVTVHTTNNRGHPPEFYAERILSRLIRISDTAPEPIKAQAIAYRHSMHSVILSGIQRACLSDRTTVIAALRKAGMEDAAKLVLTLGN